MSKKFIAKTPTSAFYVVRRDTGDFLNGRLRWAGPFGSKGAAKQSNCFRPERGDVIAGFTFTIQQDVDRLLNQALDEAQGKIVKEVEDEEDGDE